MMNKADWQATVGRGWSQHWQRTDRSFAALTHVLLDRILACGPARSILDIGCGAGELSLALAAAKPESRVLGIDVSPDLIATAQSRKPVNVRCDFVLADAASWAADDFVPDLLVSRHGVMFFDDPQAAFAHLARISGPGTRLVFSCFRKFSENPWAHEIAALLPAPPPVDPEAPGPFAFADKARVKALLEASGWSNISHEAVDYTHVTGAGHDPVADAVDFFGAIGPVAPVIRSLEGAARAGFLADLRDLAARHVQSDEVLFGAAAWIVSAQLLHPA